jgi:hypothetical protein
METRRELAEDKCRAFVAYLFSQPCFEALWEPERLRLAGKWEGLPCSLRLPPAWPPARAGQPLADYLAALPDTPPPFLLVLIQAGHSAIGFSAGGELLQHKVIKKYMVRGNGRAQVGYLETRGKSKAGSRVRLANTVSFFEDINGKLAEWEVADSAARIFYSCSEKLRPLWFGSKVAPPFDRDDPRLQKVPHDVQRPGLEELVKVNRSLQRGRWEGPAAPVDAFFESLAGGR